MLRLNDRGTAAILVAVIVTALTIPMALLVVDIGAGYGDRRALQNGADSGVLAALKASADRSADGLPPLTSAEAQQIAGEMATRNRTRGSSSAVLYDSAGVLGPVPPGPRGVGNPYYDCDYPPPSGRFLEVHATSQDTASGSWPNFFGAGKTYYACARALEGMLTSLDGGFPVTLSICEWDAATGDGSTYGPAGPYSDPVDPRLASYERLVSLQQGTGASAPPSCDRGPANQNVPGGFSWLQGPGCTAAIFDDQGLNGTGSSEANDCRTLMPQLREAREPVFLPVHNAVSGTGRGGRYDIIGYAAFVITGYRNIGGGVVNQPSWVTNQLPSCPGSGQSGTCISGFFTQALSPTGGSSGSGPGFGATAPRLVP